MFIIPFGYLTVSVGTTLALLTTSSAWAQEATMVVTHEVDDFDRWKGVFDQALPARRAAGEMASYVLHNPVEKTRVTVWFEWDTLERARAWASNPALANGMTAAGVVSSPVFRLKDLEASTDQSQVALQHR